MSYLNKFGFKSGGVALVIFGIYGFIVNLFIGFFWGFSEPLSDDLMNAVTGPLSVVTLSLFMLSALLLVSVVTRCGTHEVDLNDKKNLLVRFVVRVVEATFVMGLGIVGVLIGLAFAAHFLHVIQPMNASPHTILYAFAAMILAILYPFMVLIISLFDYLDIYKVALDLAGAAYILFVVGLFSLAGLYEAVAYLGAVMCLFIVAQSVRKKITTRV